MITVHTRPRTKAQVAAAQGVRSRANPGHPLCVWLNQRFSTIKDFCRVNGFHHVVMSYWLNGKRRIPDAAIAKISEATNGYVTASDWMDPTARPPR